jgi:hypothetical protein
LHHRFEWSQAPLFRFHVHVRSNDEFQLTMSDACLDGWSVGTLLTELLAYYFARVNQKVPPELPELPFGYSDFIALEKQAIANEESQKFWDGLVARADFAPLLKQLPMKTKSRTASGALICRFLTMSPPGSRR